MGLVFYRRLAIPLWTIALLTFALSAQPSATFFGMPPAMPIVMALLGIAVIAFTVLFVMPRLRTAPSVVPAVPPGYPHGSRMAITVAAGTRVRTLDEPVERTAEDVLDLVRMDDDGGWQMAPTVEPHGTPPPRA